MSMAGHSNNTKIMKRRNFLTSTAIGGVMMGVYPSSVANEVKNEPKKDHTPRSSKNKNLLFLFADEKSSATPAVIPTLAWLAEEAGVDFEAYVCIRPKTWANRTLAFNGNGHREQFYYLANFYDKILYCSFTEVPTVQFKREVMAFGGEIVSSRKSDELFDFYHDLFSYFEKPMPKTLTILPERPESEEEIWISPYCYPDVYFGKTLGIIENIEENGLNVYKQAGIQNVSLVYCSEQANTLAKNTFKQSEIIDTILDNDTYGKITTRIADRWINSCKGVAFGDPSCTLKWAPFYLRENVISLYEPKDWKNFIKTVARYAEKTGNSIVYGNQMVTPMDDNVVTYFSKEGMVMPLVGIDGRIGTTLQSSKTLPIDWLHDARAPWEDEYSDEFLKEQIQKGGIPVCFMLYAADLGHLPVLHRVLDLMLVEGVRCGLAFPTNWYDFQPELLEQLYIPIDLGGVFPNVEPVMVSAGVGVATEAKGFLDTKILATSLNEAKRVIAKHIGERLIPIGYYSFQDANPHYKPQTGEPQFDVIAEAGFDYAITFKRQDENARIVYERDKFIAINQQTKQWFWHTWDTELSKVKNQIQKVENRIVSEAPHGWINFAFDMPSYGLAPNYLRAMEALVEAMTYVTSGGNSKKLFIAKPHEVARYARILQKQNKL